MNNDAGMLRGFTLAFLASTAALFQCGTTSSTSGTETHWLMQCETDDECAGFQCVCGRCSLPCADSADCEAAPEASVCGSTSSAEDPDACASNVTGFCTTPDQVSGAGGTGSGGTGGSGDGGSGSGGSGSGGSGSGGFGGFDESEGPFVCNDVPNACDDGACFNLCGVEATITKPPVLSGFTLSQPNAAEGPRTPVGDLSVEHRGSSLLVYESEDEPAAGSVVYPGLSGPIVAGDQAFMQDGDGNLLHLDLSDPSEPTLDQFWSVAMDFSNIETPRPRAVYWQTEGDELVFRVGQSLSFVDASGSSPVETDCVEIPGFNGDPGGIVRLRDGVIVQVVGFEGDNEVFAYRIFDRENPGEPAATVTTLWESPAYFWEDRMVVYTDEEPPRLALYELSPDGAEELGRADFPDGASPYSWSGDVRAGLLVMEDACDQGSCPAFDMTGEAPLTAYQVEAGLFDRSVCVAEVSLGGSAEFWLSRSFPDERFDSEPDHDCGAPDLARGNTQALAWNEDATQSVLSGWEDDTPWVAVGTPEGEITAELTLGDEEYVDGGSGREVWWSGDTIVVHSGISCDLWADWLHLHDVTEPEADPVRVDFPGPMMEMDVVAGQIWALGLEGSYDCALVGQPELPKRVWRLDLSDVEAGFDTFELPEGADPDHLRVAAGTLWLIGRERTDALDTSGDLVSTYELKLPYNPVLHASEKGLLMRGSDGVVHWLEPDSNGAPGEDLACSEHFPLGSDADYFYLMVRHPGGPHLSSPQTLQRVSVARQGDAFSFETEATLPWGGGLGVAPEMFVSASGEVMLQLSGLALLE